MVSIPHLHLHHDHILRSQISQYFFHIQITFGPFDPILSDKVQFPSLYQMAPRDSSLHKGVVRLMTHFEWTWVGLVTVDDLRGEEFLQELTMEMANSGVCVSFTEKIPVSERRHTESHMAFMPRVMASPTRVIFIHGDRDSLMILRYSQFPFLANYKVWVTTSHWDITMRPRDIDGYSMGHLHFHISQVKFLVLRLFSGQ